MPAADLLRTLETLPVSLPELVVTPTTTQLFMFSAVTWNRHRIHFDKDAALAEGHSGVVVQRALLGNFLAQLLTDWLAGRGQVRELQWKVVSSAGPGRPLHCQGEVTGREAHPGAAHLRCELRIVHDTGATVATGKALCVLPDD